MTNDDRPNIIFITTDEQRWDALGINNPAIQTPFLDSLAASGSNYTRCYSSCPVCIPARRTMLSGLHPSNHETIHNTEAADFCPPVTVPQLLGERGYQTQLLGKFHVGIPGKRYGYDNIVQSETPNDRRQTPHQARNDYADWLDEQNVAPHTLSAGIMSNDRMARPYNLPEKYHHNNWVTNIGVDYLCKYRDPSSPFYLHLSYWAPHQPLLPPQAYWDRYKDNDHTPPLGEWTNHDEWQAGKPPASTHGPFQVEEMRQARAGYFGLVNHIDDQLNYLFDRWSCSRLKNDRPLLIIFSSDHGDMMGDHNLFRKQQAYEGSAHIPLFMCGRNGFEVPKGNNDTVVGLEDAAATILDAAGVERPKHFKEDDGYSLLAMADGREKPRTEMHGQGRCNGRAHERYVVKGDYKYIRYTTTGEEQLFNLKKDPMEMHDCSSEEDLSPFRASVDAHKARTPAGIDAGDCPPLKPCANQMPKAVWG